VKALVVLKPGFTKDSAAPEIILSAVATTLAPFKVPRYLEYVSELPKTPSEKIKKDVLKKARPDLTAGCWDRVMGRWR
jgi:crotonobetaine/carnitine-CoA ligase